MIFTIHDLVGLTAAGASFAAILLLPGIALASIADVFAARRLRGSRCSRPLTVALNATLARGSEGAAACALASTIFPTPPSIAALNRASRRLTRCHPELPIYIDNAEASEWFVGELQKAD